MIGFMFLTIFTVGGGALAIVQGQNPLGIFLIFWGIMFAGFTGNCYGRKSGRVMDFQELPDDEEYVYYGKIPVKSGHNANTEVAVICRASDQVLGVKLISVKGFYNNQITTGDFFTKKGDKIFIRK